MDTNKEQMIEKLNQKMESQANLIKELTRENEELYHQYNHLIIRNGKLLKRIEDFQKIINELHLRIEEMQAINGNRSQLLDKYKGMGDGFYSGAGFQRGAAVYSGDENNIETITSDFDLEDLSTRWRNYPGQLAQNAPNLRKQMIMLIQLYNHPSLVSSELFSKTGVGGVTGARYVSHLKKLGMICYTGARKKGHYQITQKGKEFIENLTQRPVAEPDKTRAENLRAKIFIESTQSKGINIDHNDL